MRDVHRSLLLLGLAHLLASSGCYLAHERDAGVDAAIQPDAAMRTDAAMRPDAAVGPCVHLIEGPSASLDGPGGVTPRLVALDEGEVGLVYVSPGGGDPTAVRYERLGASLERLTGPVLAATDSWTWAEPAQTSSGIVLAFGSTADAPTVVAPFDVDAGSPGPRMHVALPHPESLFRTPTGFFWLAFDSRDTNQFVLAHLAPDGSLLHPAQRIALGRYGSGSGVIARPDGHGEVLAYPSEGPAGTRHARVNAISERGELLGERTLSGLGADSALPVFDGASLYVLYRRDDGLFLASLDPTSLTTTSERPLPMLEGTLFAASLLGHLVVGSFQAPTLTLLDVSAPGMPRLEIRSPPGGVTGGLDWVVVPGALVMTTSLSMRGPDSTPWVVRIECAD